MSGTDIPRGRVARAVVSFLRAPENARLWWSPKEVAGELRLPESSVRKELWRVLRAQEKGAQAVIARGAHGLYRAFVDAGTVASLEVPEPVCHALQLSMASPLNRGWGAPGGEQQRTWGELGRKPVWVWTEANGQWSRTADFEGRLVTVAVTPRTGTVQVSVRASREPLRLGDLEPMRRFLGGAMMGWGLAWVDGFVTVDNVEFNLDYQTLFVREAKGVSLKRFSNAWAQVYQKSREVMRVEVRWHREGNERVSLAEVAGLLEVLTRRAVREEYAPAPPDPDAMEVA